MDNLGNLEENCNILYGLNHDITENEVKKLSSMVRMGIENSPNDFVFK